MEDKASPERTLDTHLFGLEFLQPVPAKPTVRVIFDLGVGGKHLKRFHRADINQDTVVLLYDDRYEGDRFIPPSTQPGQPIQVTFPDKDNATFDVLVPGTPSLNFELGCLDVLVLVISPEASPGPPTPKRPEEMTDEELMRERNTIPTQWPEDVALEQSIRDGSFDGGGGLV
jgi:hypothetical protein